MFILVLSGNQILNTVSNLHLEVGLIPRWRACVICNGGTEGVGTAVV